MKILDFHRRAPAWRHGHQFCHTFILTVLFCLLLCLSVGSCSQRKTAGIESIYDLDVERARARASSIIFVPGILGSELRDPQTGELIWGSFFGPAGHPAQDAGELRKLALYSNQVP